MALCYVAGSSVLLLEWGDFMKKFAKIINIIICLVLVYCVIQINELETRIVELSHNMEVSDSHLRNDMNNIYNNVNNILEEQSNQLTTNKWEYESIDIENKSVKISCIIVPKEFNPKTTKVKILNDNKEYSLDYVNGEYIAKIDIPLFDTTEFNQIQLDDNGTIRTQDLKWNITPKYETLIQTFIRFQGESRLTLGKDEYVWMPSGSIDFNVEKKGTFDIKKIELVETIDGKVVNRYQVDITSEGQRKYAEELANKGESVPENLGKDPSSYNGSVSFVYPYKKEVKIPSGSEFILYADIVDENNLVHRSYLEYIPVKKDGRIDEVKQKEFEMYRFTETHMILNENGNVLYEIDHELFK